MRNFKLIQFLFAPGELVFLFLIAGVILLWSRRFKTGKLVVTVSMAAFYCLSIRPVCDLLLYPLEHPYQQFKLNAVQKVDKVVLLSGGVEADVMRAGVVLRLYQQWLHSKERLPGIIVSGTDPLELQVDEAGEIRDYLVDRGIPSSIILLDRQSRNTRESSMNLVKLLGDKPFFLVTSAYHMSRSIHEFEQFGMHPIPAAGDFKRSRRYSLLSLIPSGFNLGLSDSAFHEYLGLLYYEFIDRWGMKPR